MVLISGFVFVFPLNKPVFNLYFVGFIGGYGLLGWFLYRVGKMPGVNGRPRFFIHEKEIVGWKRMTIGFIFGIGLLILTAAFARSGWFYVFPINQRLLWMVMFIPVTALGFRIGSYEYQMVRHAADGEIFPRLFVVLIGFIPFFFYALLLAGIGSLSGLIGGLQGLLILWLVLSSGALLQKIWHRSWLTAFYQALLLYWLVLPQGVLFR